jgi:hypothetical protein
MTDSNEPKLFKTIFQDLGQFLSDLFSGKFFKQFKTGIRELREYFLDKNRETRLGNMGRFRRVLYLNGWLFKSLILRLSSYRRVLVIFALYFIFSANSSSDNSGGKTLIATLLFLIVILLELKDKLLARDELEAGRSIQEALVPDSSPRIPGWEVWMFTRPANDVGGDLVDYMKLNGNRFGIALGDVAGKGLPAALLMAKLQSTLRALATDYTSLSELASKINAIFHRDSLPNRFASLLYMELSADSNKIRMVNAGHFPPYHIKSTQTIEFEKGAPALGIIPDTVFIENEVFMDTNEILLVYSDGLTEARNEKGAFYGEERLNKLSSEIYGLSAEEAGQKILNEVDVYMGEAAPNDDLSLVLIRRLI